VVGFYPWSSTASFPILSVISSRSLADAFSEIHGLQLVLILILSPVILSRQRNSGGIGEYTKSLPQVGQRIIETAGQGGCSYLGRRRIAVPSSLTS